MSDNINDIKKLSGIITETAINPELSLYTNASRSMPGTFALTGLKNQDAYLQYRFGVAMAGALARKEGLIDFDAQTPYGENMIVVTRTEEEKEIMDLALKLMPEYNQKTMLSTMPSQEMTDTGTTSVVGSSEIKKSEKLSESDEEYYSELEQWKKIAGITSESNQPVQNFYSMNAEATKKAQFMKENNIKPGTQEWFRLWFARKELTKEDPYTGFPDKNS